MSKKDPKCAYIIYGWPSKEYKHTESLYSHIATVHEGKKRSKNYVCDLCGTACVNRSKLKVHVEAVHEGKKPYQCDICQKAFARKPCLKKTTKQSRP